MENAASGPTRQQSDGGAVITHPLTPEQAEIVRATPDDWMCHLVVEGEPPRMERSAGNWVLCPKCHYSALQPDLLPRCPECRVSPVDWVKLTGACETCEGHACIVRWERGALRLSGDPCPDCIDGRKRVTFTVWCWVDHDVRHWRSHTGEPSPTAWCSGRVPLATATVEVLPVVDENFDDGGRTTDYVCVYADGEVEQWFYLGLPDAPWTTAYPTLHRQPVPGCDFVVVLSDVRQP